ncbi:hypothetical protein B6N60_04327 [Richelia sinica FACHB-800]|uniref:Uncharacterized protein n=1 Tax=Richelia sinica FACHB-800 TaxID=1357546 RepID=A0A975TCN0_9NOST|nr:hypothetical protein B6N60_04327 [Richelia sinica FACHB-800]
MVSLDGNAQTKKILIFEVAVTIQTKLIHNFIVNQ